ncbi:MAG TPA: LamG domain-containing protein [Planctomycetota bacterium]|nr:LamG domain-containing protein [Planctomycetota bacterium]
MRRTGLSGVVVGVFVLVLATIGLGAPLVYERFEGSVGGTISGGVTYSTSVIAPLVDLGGGALANGQPAVFDGGNSTFVTYGTGTQVTTNNFTVEAFINIAVSGQYHTIASDWAQPPGTGELRSWGFWVTDTGALRFDVSPDGNYDANDRVISASGLIVPGKWYHVAAVSAGAVSRIYVDGLQVAIPVTRSPAGIYTADNANLKIGNVDEFGVDNGPRPFNGSIDELRIEPSSLSRSQFTQSNRLRAWIRAEDGTPPNPVGAVANVVTGPDGTASGGVTYSNQVPGSSVFTPTEYSNAVSLSFNGSSGSYVAFPANLDMAPGWGGGFTVEAFINPSVISGNRAIAGEWNDNGVNQRNWALIITNTGELRWASSSDGAYDADNNVLSAAGTVTANEWQHVAAVYDNGTVRLYENYELVADQALNTPGLFDIDTALLYMGGLQWFGGGSGSQANFAGLIDEFRLSEGVLTPDQFLQLAIIPEPASAALLLLGLAALRRRRRGRAVSGPRCG